MSALPLHGRSALVTGGVGSIGEAICEELAKAGVALLAVNGHRAADDPTVAASLARVREAAAAAGNADVRVSYAHADLASAASIEEMLAAVTREWGRPVDILVNCGGAQRVAPVDELAPADWDRLLAVNLSACFHTMRLALPAMKEAGWGRIVNIASILGIVGAANKGAYCASKHGLVGLTKAVALETARTPVTANVIAPGFVDTPLLRVELEASARARYGGDVDKAIEAIFDAAQPSHKFVSRQQVAQAVVFLCTPAADEMRGSVISIDGAGAAR